MYLASNPDEGRLTYLASDYIYSNNRLCRRKTVSPDGILHKYQEIISKVFMLIALSKAKAAEAISCSIRKFDAMVLAGTMPKPRLLDEGNGGDVKKVWSAKEI